MSLAMLLRNLKNHDLAFRNLTRKNLEEIGNVFREDDMNEAVENLAVQAARHTSNEYRYDLWNIDCLEWMRNREANSIHAIVTDPPYGFREYTEAHKRKLKEGRGGVWRIPPTLDGCVRRPLPRFTTLTNKDLEQLGSFFTEWAKLAHKILVPGGHIILAANPLLSHCFYNPILNAGFEKRGEIIRLVQTLRGGDRPKGSHKEYSDVTVMPRSAWEPWGLFRKPLEMKVSENLKKWKTGGLRRESEKRPFTDVIQSAPTQSKERLIVDHPSLKPQALMRQLVRASLPLGEGIVLDPFAGGGATIAASIHCKYQSIGLELDGEYFQNIVAGVEDLAKYQTKEEKNQRKAKPKKKNQGLLLL